VIIGVIRNKGNNKKMMNDGAAAPGISKSQRNEL